MGSENQEPETEAAAPCVGIFLGAERTAVAVVTASGDAQVVADAAGRRWTQSCVAWDSQGVPVVGCSTHEREGFNPKAVVSDVFALLGRAFDDHEVQQLAARVPYDIVDIDGKPYVAVPTAQGECQAVTPEQVLALLVARQKQIAEEFLGQEVKDVVVTLPAALNNRQRDAVMSIGRDAGVNVLRCITGSISGCIGTHNGVDPRNDTNEHLLLVLSRDGAQITVTLINFEEEVFEVLSAENIDASDMKSQVPDEKAKESAFDRALAAADAALQQNRKQRDNLEVVYVLGEWDTSDSSISRAILEYAGNPAVQIHIEASEAFESARGAAIHAQALAQPLPQSSVFSGCLFQVFGLSMGVETAGGVMTTVVNRNTTIPHVGSRIFTPIHEQQSTVVFKVFEGCRIWTAHNRFLGQLELNNLQRRSDLRLPQVKVTFDMDYDQNLVVVAEEIGTDNKAILSLTSKEQCPSLMDYHKFVEASIAHYDEDTGAIAGFAACTSMDGYLANVAEFASCAIEEHGVAPAFTSDCGISAQAEDPDWIRLEAASISGTAVETPAAEPISAKLGVIKAAGDAIIAKESCTCS